MTTRRLFAAVLPSPAATRQLSGQLAGHQQLPVRWNDPATWHVTLLFTPSVDDHLVAPFTDGLARIAAGSTAFPLALDGGGAFPSPERARHLIALPADPTGSLPLLNERCRALADELAIGHEGRPYQPHLTIARLNSAADCCAEAGWLAALRTEPWPVEELVLVESHLARRGPAHHELLARFPTAR